MGTLLPAIERPNARGLFVESTPDTAGMAKRRFHEIIDSDDETNGNGSHLQRVQKKFKNTKDNFGDVSCKGIDFPIKE